MFWLQPFIAAFTGWFTTWIAVFMLFHPREPRRFLGITIQGIFPKRQAQFAIRLGNLVANELLHFDEIANLLKDPAHLSGLKPSIEGHIDNFLKHRLKEKMPVISMFMGKDTLDSIKSGLLEEIDLMLPDLISGFADRLSTQVDIERMVTEKVSRFSSDKLEAILAGVMSKEFRFVELIGGVLGFLIGLIQMGLSLI